MNKSLLTFIIFFFLASLATATFKPVTLSVDNIINLEPTQSISLLVAQQEELYKKALRDYLETFINDNNANEEINKKIYQAITSSDVFKNVEKFMIQALFNKFEMNTLSTSFAKEIKEFPDNYFLTFEMYDLLHD